MCQIQAELTFETDNHTQILWTFRWRMTDNLLCDENLKWKHKKQRREVFTYLTESSTNRIQVGNEIIDGLRLSGSILAILDTNIIRDKARMPLQPLNTWKLVGADLCVCP